MRRFGSAALRLAALITSAAIAGWGLQGQSTAQVAVVCALFLAAGAVSTRARAVLAILAVGLITFGTTLVADAAALQQGYDITGGGGLILGLALTVVAAFAVVLGGLLRRAATDDR